MQLVSQSISLQELENDAIRAKIVSIVNKLVAR